MPDVCAQVIRPHLARGGIILCDRYIDSTLAYQGYGHGLDIATLKTILQFAADGLRPDLTIYFDITPENALRRKQQASLFGEEWTRLDDMEFQFHKRVYEGYRQLRKEEPSRWAAIDAMGTIDEMAKTVAELLDSRLSVG
jgi:dTMP kinase